jgi:hypothetical protein
MTLSPILGIRAVHTCNIPAHRARMLRAYAIGMGTGTRVFTHLPWVLLVGQPTEAPHAMPMIGGWLITLTVAETRIAKDKRRAEPTRRKPLTFP